MRVQLWSYNYDPEPTGIGPVSRVLAQGLVELGHEVDVVAAHPHYPEPAWGTKLLPYRELRDGIRVLRLPLWIGRESAAERYRQEISFTLAQSGALPALGSPDVVISASPSFPALLPGVLNSRVRRVPWVIWLHDILPDGAAATGLIEEGWVLRASRALERMAYRTADRIVVLSSAFVANLRAKAVPDEKVELIYDPATRTPSRAPAPGEQPDGLRVLSMGNIGHTQGLAPLVGAFEQTGATPRGVKLVICGNGVAAPDVTAEIRSDRVEMLGLVDDGELERQLLRASIGLVTQQYSGPEFNIPSKLMNFMAYGLPVLAAVNPEGEVAHIVRSAGAGWVVPSSPPELFPHKLAEIAAEPAQIAVRAEAARAYAAEHFTPSGFAKRFEATLVDVVERATSSRRRTAA